MSNAYDDPIGLPNCKNVKCCPGVFRLEICFPDANVKLCCLDKGLHIDALIGNGHRRWDRGAVAV